MYDDRLHAATMHTLNIIDSSIVYLRTSCYLSCTQSHCSHFERKMYNMGSAIRRQKRCSRKFNAVSKKKAAGILRGIFHSSPQHNIQVNLFTKNRSYIYKTLTYINIGVVNEIPTQTGEDPITVDTTGEYYTSVISLSYNSQSRQ